MGQKVQNVKIATTKWKKNQINGQKSHHISEGIFLSKIFSLHHCSANEYTNTYCLSPSVLVKKKMKVPKTLSCDFSPTVGTVLVSQIFRSPVCPSSYFMSPILVGGLVKLFSTPLGGFLLLFGALHIRFCPCRCSFGFGPSSAWFSSVPVLCIPRYTLKTIFRVSLRQKTTKPSFKVLRTGGFCV